MTTIMIIGIDGNEANQKIRVGSGVYSFELLRQFKKSSQPKADQPRAEKFKVQSYLKNEPLKDLPQEGPNWKYTVIGPKKFWTQLALPIRLWKEKICGQAPDVFFTPTHYAPRFCPIPSVITIFDLSFIRFPQLFLKKDLYQLKNWTEYSVRQAKKIITISQFSKKEIIDHYKINPDKIVVAYPGYDNEKFKVYKVITSKIDKTKEKYRIIGDYILFIGTVQPRKNLARLIEAFYKLKTTTQNLKLVICGMIGEGRGGWMQEEIFDKTKNKEQRTKNNIIITGYVDDNDLLYLIAGAKAFVLPSLYEGFGIPAVEAMACGVPVVVSNISSLPEVVGDAGILVDPYDINSIAKGIEEACFNEEKRERLIKTGLERVKIFSWEESTKNILKVLTEFDTLC